ncbi:unnamed protein product [Xylocopa violacea]|uniref:Small ribosomal subunit protein mS39 n=1 Tax=Xylocopa violacea TaxID=135666 RepID=A0ABP1NEE3_XYLVO
MNFKRISHRISLCELKRLQSSLSTSNSKIQIPARIKRGPTDILQALDSTIPEDYSRISSVYHDDPYLIPVRKTFYYTYGLSYESGKKTAMWIHKKHSNLFPKHLSEPAIDAFQPPVQYTDKDQVSEEILLQVISQRRISDALDIYKLLETNVSNQAKQALLELLCFYNDKNSEVNKLIFEQWCATAKKKYIMWHSAEINELYQFLKKQDPLTAAAAHNAMICGLAKYLRVDEAMTLYHNCKQKNVPFNVTTYNYVLRILPKTFNHLNNVQFVLDILREMNEKKIKPNVNTLNAALKVVTAVAGTKKIVDFLFGEFERINIKFSLATYYYRLRMYSSKDKAACEELMEILRMLKDKSFTVQDWEDNLFFGQAMHLAGRWYDKKAAGLINDLLLTGNNRVFISNSSIENNYYIKYISILLWTSTVKEFFDHYEKIVPSLYVPQISLLWKILNSIQCNKTGVEAKYLLRLWSDINIFSANSTELMCNCIQLMKIDTLPPCSPLRTAFVDAALSCWNTIKKQLGRKENFKPLNTDVIAHIALMLLQGKHIEEAIEVLTIIINQPDMFILKMSEQQVNELFDTFMSEQCITGALLALECASNLGFQNVIEMGTKLNNLPELTSVERNKLLDLIGLKTLDTLDTPESS